MDTLVKLFDAFGPVGGLFAAALVAVAIWYRRDMFALHRVNQEMIDKLNASLGELRRAIDSSDRNSRANVDALVQILGQRRPRPPSPGPGPLGP